nr:Wzz/FepE/Etk N-terminal domain-containing protein [Streptomyces coryli]
MATIGRIFRRRWRLLAALTLLGALVGYGISLLTPPKYTTSTSVLLPGAWEERELLTQAQLATSSAVVDRAAAKLDWSGVGGKELRGRVSAKAANANVVKISGTADTPERAQRLSDEVARQFIAFGERIAGDSTASGPESLRKKVEQTNRRITELANATDPGKTVESVQARTRLEELRTALEEAMTKLNESDPAANKASMVVMGAAAKPTTEAPPTRTQLVGGGALLFFLSAVIGHLAATRASRRLRTEAEIATALGSTLLGSVDVPGERPGEKPQDQSPRARIRRLLDLDTRWDVPPLRTSGGEESRRIRYGRVCARIRDRLPGSRRLLVVVPEGDEVARRAAGQLVVEAEGDPSPSSSSRGYPMLRVVDVSVHRPMVPDRGQESGVLVVLSAGSWTAAELAGIAGACADGRHEVVGIVLAGAVRARPAGPADPPPDAGDPPDDGTLAFAVHSHGTGGSP